MKIDTLLKDVYSLEMFSYSEQLFAWAIQKKPPVKGASDATYIYIPHYRLSNLPLEAPPPL